MITRSCEQELGGGEATLPTAPKSTAREMCMGKKQCVGSLQGDAGNLTLTVAQQAEVGGRVNSSLWGLCQFKSSSRTTLGLPAHGLPSLPYRVWLREWVVPHRTPGNLLFDTSQFFLPPLHGFKFTSSPQVVHARWFSRRPY